MLNATACRFGDPTLPPRFWRKVEVIEDGCWLWLAGTMGSGYGVFSISNTSHLSHRVAYLALVGDIASGLVIDHLCRVRRCVNPAHLEVVTNRENILRGEGPTARWAKVTRCAQGHEFDSANTVIRRATRCCRTCERDRARRDRARRAGRSLG